MRKAEIVRNDAGTCWVTLAAIIIVAAALGIHTFLGVCTKHNRKIGTVVQSLRTISMHTEVISGYEHSQYHMYLDIHNTM